MQFSVVQFQEIKDSGFRADAEYWHPELIANSQLISSAEKIGDFVVSRVPNIKSTPINRDFDYLEISQISMNGCEYHTIRVERGDEPDRAHYILKETDVVVSTVRPNRNAVAFIKEDDIIGSSGLCVLRAEDLEPGYLFAFCKTDYFVKCLVRSNKATMYPAVSNRDVLETPILVGSEKFRALVSSLVADALEHQDASSEYYAAAERILLTTLQLSEWQPSNQIWSIRNVSDLRKTGRIDAEYYQPKYDDIVNTLRNYAGGWDTFGNLVKWKDNHFNPGAATEYRYIELANITRNGEIADCTVGLGADLPGRARRKVSVGDVIVSSIEGSLDSIALIGDEYDGALCSTGFHVVNSSYFNSETLLVLLKSIAGQMQLKKGSSGTILSAISKNEIGKVVLPLITGETQIAIQQKIAESTAMRQGSRRLLETAKRAVEIAIEQDESTAIAWLATQQEEMPCRESNI